MILKSAFFVIAFAALFSGLLLCKKTEKKENIIVWITMCIIFIMCLNGFLSTLIKLIKLPRSVVFMGGMDLICAIPLWMRNIKKGTQKYCVTKLDLVFSFLAVAMVAYIAHARYGSDISINFCLIDSANHYSAAHSVAFDHKYINNLYLAALNSGLAMETFLPILGDFNVYKIFIVWESGYFLLQIMTLCAIIRRMTDKKSGIVTAGIMSLLYGLGYPLYVLEFGFSYLGVSIAVLAMIIFALELYNETFDEDAEGVKQTRAVAVAMMFCGLYGIFICYTLFVPFVFVGAFLALCIIFKQKDKLFSVKTVIRMLIIFLIPSALGMLESFVDLQYLSEGSGANNAAEGAVSTAQIAVEGGCYNELYSNFVLMLPFILYGGYLFIKRRKGTGVIGLTIVLLMFSAAMFVLALKGRVSVYYLIKVMNPLWLVAYIMVFAGFTEIYSKSRALMICIALTFAFLFGMVYTRTDEKILNINNRLIRVTSDCFLNVYAFTHEFMKSGRIDANGRDLMKYADAEFPEDAGIIAVGDDVYTTWFKALTGRSIDNCNFSDQLEKLKTTTAQYMVVEYSIVYYENAEYIDSLGEKIISNDSGYIMKIN